MRIERVLKLMEEILDSLLNMNDTIDILQCL